MNTERTNGIVVVFPDGRVVPGQLIVGISEIANAVGISDNRQVSRKTACLWVSHRETSGCPDPLPLGPGGRLARGTVWDLRDIARWKGFGFPDDLREYGDRRVISSEKVVGLQEVKKFLDESGLFASRYPPSNGGVPAGRISTWSSRCETTGFPRALHVGPGGTLGGGSLWDLDELIPWEGPPGRWAQSDPNDGLEDGRVSFG